MKGEKDPQEGREPAGTRRERDIWQERRKRVGERKPAGVEKESGRERE